MLAWILAYVLVIGGFFVILHHFDHTHVVSNYSFTACH